MPYYDAPGSLYDHGLHYADVPTPQPKGRSRMSKSKLAMSGMTAEEVCDLATRIVTMMTANANFTTPNPTLASITTQKNTTSTSITAHETAQATADEALTTRDSNVATLKGLLSQLSSYVDNASGGDAAKIESSGMSVRADSTVPVGQMTQVLDLVLTAGDFEGTLDAMWTPTRGAKSYEVQISPDPPGTWTQKMASGKSSATLEGLTSGAKIWVRVRAVGANNKPGPWSDPAVKIVP
jgi:hypothetical protein